MIDEFIAENLPLLIALLVWSLAWTGLALWKAARRSDKLWFIVLLILNTIGLLEIFYIFFFSKRDSAPRRDNPEGEDQ